MAPVEAELCVERFRHREQVVQDLSVEKGSIHRSRFLAPAKILITCEANDEFGAVIIKGGRFLEVWLYENESDQDGELKDAKKPIKFSGDQEVEIWALHKRRQMYIWHEKNDSHTTEEKPSDKRPIKV